MCCDCTFSKEKTKTYLTSPSDTESANGGTLITSNIALVAWINLDWCIHFEFIECLKRREKIEQIPKNYFMRITFKSIVFSKYTKPNTIIGSQQLLSVVTLYYLFTYSFRTAFNCNEWDTKLLWRSVVRLRPTFWENSLDYWMSPFKWKKK